MLSLTNSFRAMRSLLFSLSNSASSLGTRLHTKANLIKEASSQRSWAWELDRFSPAVDSLSLNSRLDTLESVSDSENVNFAGKVISAGGDRSGLMTGPMANPNPSRNLHTPISILIGQFRSKWTGKA